MDMNILNQNDEQLHTYRGCFPGSFDKRDCKLSSLVPNIVIFFLVEDDCRWASGPDAGQELHSETMLLISSASFVASLYSFTHASEEAIDLKEWNQIQWFHIKKWSMELLHNKIFIKLYQNKKPINYRD